MKSLIESREIALSSASLKQCLSLIGSPIPYFIQVFVAEIANELALRPGPMGSKRLEELYQNRVLGASCKSYFQHYYDRLRTTTTKKRSRRPRRCSGTWPWPTPKLFRAHT